MKFSTILSAFWVMPLNQSEVVGFTIDQDSDGGEATISVSWKDSDTGNEHFQCFDDQEVVAHREAGSTSLNGAFTVQTTEGETVAFLALAGVNPRVLGSTPEPAVGRPVDPEALGLVVDGSYVHLQVGKFSVQVKHELEGIVIDVYGNDGSGGDVLATLYAADPEPEEG